MILVAQDVPTIPSVEVALAFVNIAVSNKEEVERDGGLILTEEDIISIKFYVRYGLSLPQTEKEIKNYLGYDQIGIPGLEPTDFKNLFSNIRANVLKWDPLETKIINQGRYLETFSSNITIVGEDLIAVINEMPILERMRQTVGETIFPFSPEDEEIAMELTTWLDDLRDDINIEKGKTEDLQKEITSFRRTITQELRPDVFKKQNLIATNNLDRQIEELRTKIADLNQQIDELEKDYKKFIGLAFTGAPGGLIGLAITGTIFGKKAEEARNKKNKLLVEKEQLNQQVSEKVRVKAAVENTNDNLTDISIRLQDAEEAANHLQFVWDTIYHHIDASYREFENINEGTKLVRFTTEFKKVINPWNEVKGITNQLIKIFDEALRKYNELTAQKLESFSYFRYLYQKSLNAKNSNTDTLVSKLMFSISDGFIPADVEKMSRNKGNIINFSRSFKTEFLPSIQLKCVRLSQEIPNFHDTLRNTNLEIKVKVSNNTVDEHLSIIQEIINELENPNLSPEDRELLIEGEREQRQLLNQELTSIKVLVENKTKFLNNELLNIKEIIIQKYIEDVIVEKNEKEASLKTTIHDRELKRQELITEKETIIEALEIMRRENLFDIFQDFLPTPEDINNLDLTQPEKEIIKEAVRIYKKLFGHISQGLTYANLAKHRDNLIEQIDSINAEISLLMLQLEDVQAQIWDLSLMSKIDSERNSYAQEVNNILQSYEFFYTKLGNLIKLEATVYAEIKELLQEMVNYLNQTRIV